MNFKLNQVSSGTIARAAVFTAFVAAATSAFSISIPATGGYFNVGEVMVYTSALLMGPYIGAFAGGVGSMLSDLSLGYPFFAPGTLLIKGAEGFIVGYFSWKVFPKVTRSGWRGITVLGSLSFALMLSYIGTSFLSGVFSSTIGGVWSVPAYTVEFTVPWFFWIVLASLSFVSLMYFGLRAEERSGLAVLSVLIGGAEMVSGYYLYESFVIGLIAPGSVVSVLRPAAELPFNVAQSLIGLLVSVPLARSIGRMTPRLVQRKETPSSQLGSQKT